MNTVSASQVYRASRATAWIAGVFLICVSTVMLYQRFTASSNDPWKSPQLLELKEQLRASPKDERIKERIRDLDLKFRQRYVRRLAMTRSGGWLLLGGGIVVIVALTVAMETRKTKRRLPKDPGAGDRALREAAAARRGVAVGGGVVACAMVAVALGIRSSITEEATAAGKETAAGEAAPPAELLPPPAEFLANWPRFRGPTGGGVAASPEAPVKWDGKTGAGIRWKSEVPAPGFGSPIVWGDRLFVSGGTREKREVMCYETAGGKLLWQRTIDQVPGSPAQVPEIPDQTGFAASTMATDGRRAYVIFANGDLAAVTFEGTVAWSKHLGVPRNLYGHATSLAIWQGRVVVQFDQGETGPANSRLIAIAGATGRILWEKPRPMPSSWATPIIVEAAGKTQIITLGAPLVMAYALADGRELWRADLLEGEVTSSPAFAGGLVLAINPSNALLALRPDGAGDVTKSHVVWKAEDEIPDVTSPVSNGELVFTVNSGGAVVCFDLKDGKKVWEQDLGTEVQASPAIAGDRLYITCGNGLTVVIEVGREYKELARNELGGKFFASPAFGPGRIYLRGVDHLYCLASDAAPPARP